LGLGGAQQRFSKLPAQPAIPLDDRQQLKKVVDMLRSERKAWTIAELKVHTEVNVLEHPVGRFVLHLCSFLQSVD
jgi:hypothetical protein